MNELPYFDNEGVKIHYEIEGNGPDLIMIHGFASNIENNWREDNWIKSLKDQNRLILIDCRGHGLSDKPKDPTQYGIKMIEDISKLMNHLSIKKSNIFGYSMGARLALNFLLDNPQYTNSVILGGFNLLSENAQEIRQIYEPIIKAFKVGSITQVKDPIGLELRRFAEKVGNDLNALAAVLAGFFVESNKDLVTRVKMNRLLKKIMVPVLIVVGSADAFVSDIRNENSIVNQIPGASYFQIQGKDHYTVVADPKFHMVVKAFLNFVNNK